MKSRRAQPAADVKLASSNSNAATSVAAARISWGSVGQGRRAVWDEKFKFKVDYFGVEQYQQHQHKLILQIMDHDSFTHHDCLGQATIYLNDLFEVGMEKGKAELCTQKYRIVSADKTYRGEIQVGITFTVNGGIDQLESADDGMKAKAS